MGFRILNHITLDHKNKNEPIAQLSPDFSFEAEAEVPLAKAKGKFSPSLILCGGRKFSFTK